MAGDVIKTGGVIKTGLAWEVTEVGLNPNDHGNEALWSRKPLRGCVDTSGQAQGLQGVALICKTARTSFAYMIKCNHGRLGEDVDGVCQCGWWRPTKQTVLERL